MAKTIQEAGSRIRDMYQRAQEALQKNNVAYAVDLFLSILEMEPELEEVRTELRKTQMDSLQGKKANHSMSSLKGMSKLMGLKSVIKKHPEKALAAAEELLKIDPFNPSFLDAYCAAAEAAKIPGAAAITLEAVTKVDSKNADLVEKLGHLYLRMGESHKARRVFEALGDLRPGDQQVIKWIKDSSAMDTMVQGKWEQEGSFRKSLKNEDEASSLEQASRSQQTVGDLGRMIATQRLKLKQEPNNLNLYRPLADSLVKNEEFDEALEVLEKADELANHADPMIQRAITRVTVEIYEHNAKVLREQGDEAGAVEQIEARNAFLLEDAADKVKRYPNDLGFKFEYGQLLFDRGEIDQAIGQFQQAQRNPQRRIDALYLLGSCFKAKKQYDIAAAQLQKAAEELPTMDDRKKAILYELGEVLDAQGEIDAALEYFKQIYAVDIGYKQVSTKIEEGYRRRKAQQG
jgi:tetratricopeptide (TPR) repeat protein